MSVSVNGVYATTEAQVSPIQTTATAVPGTSQLVLGFVVGQRTPSVTLGTIGGEFAWTAIATNDPNVGFRSKTAWAIGDASDDLMSTTFSGGSNQAAAQILLVLDGADLSTPIQDSGTSSGSSGNPSFTSLTGAVGDLHVVFGAARDFGYSFTPTSGYTMNFQDDGGVAALGPGFFVQTKVLTGTSTGSGSVTASPSNPSWLTHGIVVKASSGGGGGGGSNEHGMII